MSRKSARPKVWKSGNGNAAFRKMHAENPERGQQSELAVNEQDDNRLLELVREINRLHEEKQEHPKARTNGDTSGPLARSEP